MTGVGLMACNFIKKRLRLRYFPVYFAKIFRTPTLKNIWERLLLSFIKKETPTQAVSCEFWEFFKTIFFIEHLRTVGFKTPLPGTYFNKVASLTAWRPVKLLERHSSAGICLWILRNFPESSFVQHVLATTSHIMLLFPFCRSVRFAA